MKILVINGPNLNLLGKRETDIYGRFSLDEINDRMLSYAKNKHWEIEFFQSNHEGDIVDKINKCKDESFDYLIINPAAYTHTSIAIADAIKSVEIPTIEVHLSNIYSREEFRHKSLIAYQCKGQITGFGINSYILALEYISLENKN